MRPLETVVLEPSPVLVLWPPQALSDSPGSLVPWLSQPSSAPGAPGRERSEAGALQLGVHSPPTQWRALAPALEQARPQAPQWSTSPPMSTTQPAAGSPQA